MFEATRAGRWLLRRLDGFDAVTNTITIGATNRKMISTMRFVSRFDQTIHFPLPNERSAAIFGNYAAHLSQEELDALGRAGEGLSGRNIRDVCELQRAALGAKILVKP